MAPKQERPGQINFEGSIIEASPEIIPYTMEQVEAFSEGAIELDIYDVYQKRIATIKNDSDSSSDLVYRARAKAKIATEQQEANGHLYGAIKKYAIWQGEVLDQTIQEDLEKVAVRVLDDENGTKTAAFIEGFNKFAQERQIYRETEGKVRPAYWPSEKSTEKRKLEVDRLIKSDIKLLNTKSIEAAEYLLASLLLCSVYNSKVATGYQEYESKGVSTFIPSDSAEELVDIIRGKLKYKYKDKTAHENIDFTSGMTADEIKGALDYALTKAREHIDDLRTAKLLPKRVMDYENQDFKQAIVSELGQSIYQPERAENTKTLRKIIEYNRQRARVIPNIGRLPLDNL